MATSTLTIRIDEELKSQAADVAEYYGLDLSSVTRAFYKQMVNTQAIPLTFEPGQPTDESRVAIAEGNAYLETHCEGRFTSGAELLEAALA